MRVGIRQSLDLLKACLMVTGKFVFGMRWIEKNIVELGTNLYCFHYFITCRWPQYDDTNVGEVRRPQPGTGEIQMRQPSFDSSDDSGPGV